MKTLKRKQYPLITVICDNYSFRNDLEPSWGFSCLIHHQGKNILFDTGGDGIVLKENMGKLGVDPASIDMMMISHQHWDHTGGIYYILSAKHNLPVCLPHSFSARFKEDIKRYGAKVIEVEKAEEILPDLYSTGDMGRVIREQSALLRTQTGIIVITGCAHPGIIRIIKNTKKLLPDYKIALVMGGFHLLDDDDDRILDTITQFKRLDVRYAAASHCSGQKARSLFAREYRDKFIALGTGRVITPEDLR